jgi:transposase InsO family protein
MRAAVWEVARSAPTTASSSQSRRFRAACRDYRLRQEFITPYTPEQNGLVERFFRSLKEECVWQHGFPSFVEARRAVRRWIRWYNGGRPPGARLSQPAPISGAKT